MDEIGDTGKGCFQTINNCPIPVVPSRIGPVLSLSTKWTMEGQGEWVAQLRMDTTSQGLWSWSCSEGNRQGDMGTGP